MLGNWEHRGAGSWRDAVAAWLPEGLDAWVIERELQDPVEYATMWLRDGGLTPERDPGAFDAALEAWIDDFEARDVRGVGFGYLIVHRPGRPREPDRWATMSLCVELFSPAGPARGFTRLHSAPPSNWCLCTTSR